MRFHIHAGRNARILFKLSLANGELEAALKDMSVLKESFLKDTPRWKALSNPLVPLEGKTDFFRKKFSKTVADFLKVLVKKGETSLIPSITEEFSKLVKKHKKVEEVIIETALPLDEKQLVGIGESVSKALSRKVNVVEMVVPEILGGLIIHFKDLVVDRSFRSHLEGLRELLGK